MADATSDSPQWWNVVQWDEMSRRDWVTHTMPAVDSMARGVAPIGRSMQQAAAILMNRVDGQRGGATPSIVEPDARMFEEHTSTLPKCLTALA